uniref:HTH CENPB-type domain-containing protein n=1 Tax=Chrysemys picta bellii TaxID=8478 RepID=A0A8C3FG12_CHRPI
MYLQKQKNQILNFFAKSDSKKRMSVRKTLTEGKSSDLDSALIHWFMLHRNDSVSISGEMMMAQHECDYSQGWLQKFKNRPGISLHCVCDEKRSADMEAAANYADEFAQLVANEKLSPEQVYNADETALYWHCTPKKNVDDDEDIVEKISIDKCIQLATHLIEGLEQRHFISEQEITQAKLEVATGFRSLNYGSLGPVFKCAEPSHLKLKSMEAVGAQQLKKIRT